VLPHVTFRDGNPLLLTVEGEFVVKNIVLIVAALVVGTTVQRDEAARAEPRASRAHERPRTDR
jgi:hypothetical protein